MVNINECQKILEFYRHTNKLKTKIFDSKNQFSRADHLFGSLILATVCDSEFQDAVDLSKVYRMLFFNSFSAANRGYDFDSLKMGVQYQAELEEYRANKTRSAQYAHKYKRMEEILTSFITDNEGKLSEEELLHEGSKVLASLLKKPCNACKEVFRFFYLNRKLTKKDRSGWDQKHWAIKSNRIERVSEHIVSTLGLAIAFQSELDYPVNYDKVMKTIVLHETGETLMPDVTPFDGITPEEKKEMEHKAMRDALGNLSARNEYLALLFGFDDRLTKEDKLSHKFDKVEADLQAKVYLEKGLHHSLDDQAHNVVFLNPRILKMIEDGASDAYDVFFEWDRSIYEGDKDFPEFFQLIQLAKDNPILKDTYVLKTKVKLSPEEIESVSEEVGPLLKKLHGHPNIEAVYLNQYSSEQYPHGVLSFTIVMNKYNDDMTNMLEILNQKNEEKNSSIGISYHPEFSFHYDSVPMNPSEVRRAERIEESKILFDTKGDITKLKKRMKSYGHLFRFYFLDYEPPVGEILAKPYQKISKTV